MTKITPELRKLVLQINRRNETYQNWDTIRALPRVHHAINDRARYRRLFDRHAEDGKVAIIRDGMDCDCNKYTDVNHMDVPVSLFMFQREELAHEHWLDGPESTCFGRPSDYPTGHVSRDLAAEAFEDGHAHVVYA